MSERVGTAPSEHVVVDRRATYREVLAERRFRVLFFSRSLSIAAETLRMLALSVLVFAVTGSPLLGAIAFGVGFLPQAIGGVLLGAVADRVAPRLLIAGGYLVESLTAMALAVLPLPVGASLALVAAVACLTPVFNGASSRVIADVLTGDAYVLGRSLTSMSSSAAQLLGLAGGGVAVAALGPRHALLVSAGGNLLAATWVRLRLPVIATPRSEDRPSRVASAVRDSWTGSVRLLRDWAVRRLMLAHWLPPALVTGAEALLVPYAGARGFPAGSAGALLAALPVGMLAGALVVGRFVRPAVRERLTAPLVVLLGAPMLVLLARPPLPVVVALLVVAGAGFAYTLGLQRRFLAAVPEAMRGQSFALLSTGLMTLQGVGPLATGGVAEWTGPAIAIALAGGATISLAPLVLASRNREPSRPETQVEPTGTLS